MAEPMGATGEEGKAVELQQSQSSEPDGAARPGELRPAQRPPWPVPLSPPLIREDQLIDVLEAYRSGWLTMGSRTKDLELKFEAYSGAPHCLAVSSCSAALHLACLSSGVGRGDEVVLPSLTFAATANAVAHTGAECVFADIESLERPWVSVESVEAAITPASKAVIAVWYAGYGGEVSELAALAASHGLHLIEDAAHGSGSWLGERHAGTFGTAGALSFSGGKNLGIGEGGMVMTADPQIAQRVRSLRWHGISSSTWERSGDMSLAYDVSEAGFNYRIDDPRAALARARLRYLDEENAARAEIASTYRAAFGEREQITMVAPSPENEQPSHCMFTIVLDRTVDRDAFRASLAEHGVETSIHFPPLHLSRAYRATGIRLPVTEEFARRAVSLPIFPHMEEWQVELAIDAVNAAVGKARGGPAGIL